MSADRSGNLSPSLLLATALALTMLPASSQAYTPEQQQACTPDAMRLCGEFVPDVDRITACMVRNKAQLSPQCRVYFRPGPEEVGAASAGSPMSLDPPHKPAAHKAHKSKKSPAT